MKRFYIILLLMLPVLAWGNPVEVRIQINNSGKKAICSFETPDTAYQVIPDENGLAVFVLQDDARKGYGTFFYSNLRMALYFNGESFTITVTPEEKTLNPKFEGPGAPINTYLNTRPLLNWVPDYKLEDEAFAICLNEEEKRLVRNLDSCMFDTDFTRMERSRLHYDVQGRMAFYPLFHKYAVKAKALKEPSEAYYRVLRSLLVEDETLLDLIDYKLTLSNAVNFIAIEGVMKASSLEKLKLKLDFIDQNLKHPAIVSYLMDGAVKQHMRNGNIEGYDYFGPIYNKKVIDKKAKKEFNELCAQLNAIAPGSLSPDFCYPDMNGKDVSLKDLAGKYVYIDIWATWCAPCRAEAPALKELAKKYAGKDIHFVSMSSDGNKKTWEKMVKEEQLPGIQLFMNGDRKFMDAYMIEGIPHFILLDKEGKIVESNLIRPSNKQTTEMLDELLN